MILATLGRSFLFNLCKTILAIKQFQAVKILHSISVQNICSSFEHTTCINKLKNEDFIVTVALDLLFALFLLPFSVLINI